MARTIVEGGFSAYYETRTTSAERPRDHAPLELTSERSETALILQGVRCAACLWLIEQVLARSPGVSRASVNYATRRAQLAWDPAETSLAAIVGALRAVGYDALPYEPQRAEELYRRERRAALWRLFIAGFGAMQVMMYAFPAYISNGELSTDAESLMRWASLLLTAPVLIFACPPFFRGALAELRTRRLGLDTPIALGLAGAYGASAWATIAGAGAVYFDSISMLAFLLLAARYAQMAATRRASAQLDRLLGWTPSAELRVGERRVVAPGERVPADGVVEAGASSADESLLTGESRPVPKGVGDAVLAGSVNYEQPLTVRVTRAGADTQAAAIARLAERAGAERPPLVAAADRIARHVTVLVLAVAALAALYWGDVGVAVAVLVATCPCALGLAAPIVFARANGHLVGRGALVTRAAAYEALARVTDVVLDKTGTLTTGELTLARVFLLGGRDEHEALVLARSLEAASRHPVSRAFGDGTRLEPDALEHFAGHGIEASFGARRARIGTEAFCRGLGLPPAPVHPNLDACRVFLADEHEWIAAFELRDSVRPEAAGLIAALGERGLAVHLASGDRWEAGAALARLLWIERYAGAMTPEDKCEYAAKLQREGRVVAMVGDGLNDTPVLARADVSFAMGAGADAAQLSADVVLPGNRLGAIVEALDVSRRAMTLVRENFGWALLYNGAALAAAAAGMIGPWQAALGMAASSLVVVLNAARSLAAPRRWTPVGPGVPFRRRAPA